MRSKDPLALSVRDRFSETNNQRYTNKLELQVDTKNAQSWQMDILHAQLNEQELTTVAWSATVVNAGSNELSDLTSPPTNFWSTIFQWQGQ
jgi:hypothetical protein